MILVDTREQKNQHLLDWFDKKNIKYESKALSNGDYSFYIPKQPELNIDRAIYFDQDIMIERKNSLDELSGNLTQSRARFQEEMATFGGKKYLLIERANYSDIVNHNYDTQFSQKAYLASVHSFNHRYGLEIVFMPDNSYSPVWIYGTFSYYLRDLLR